MTPHINLIFVIQYGASFYQSIMTDKVFCGGNEMYVS